MTDNTLAAGAATGAPDSGEDPPYRYRWIALAVVLAAEIMDLLDSTIVNVAAPSIRSDLGGSYAMIQWIAAGYTLAYAVGLVTGGRLGDVFGRKRMFILGAAGFTAASLLCATAVSPQMLIAVRVVQGAFGAILIPQGLGIIRGIFPPSERATAFGMFGPAIGLAAVCGPIVAGAVVSADIFGTGWRMVFGINLPVGLLAILGAVVFLPESRGPGRTRLDPVGMLLVTAAAVALVFPLVQGRELGWPVWGFVLMAASLPLGGLFGWYQLRLTRRGRDPLVVTSVFRRPGYTAGTIVLVVFFTAMTGMLLTFGLLLQIGLGFSPIHAGLTYAPWSFALAVGAALAGAVLAPRYGRRVLHGGLVIMAAGVVGIYLTLRQAGPDVTSWQLVPALFVTGIGMGLLVAPMFDIVLAGVTDEEAGSAAGVLNAGQQFASALGVAVIGTVLLAGLGAQAGAAANGAAPALRAGLAAASVAPADADRLAADLGACAHDAATAEDPSARPDSCVRLAADTRAAASPREGARVAAAVAQAGSTATREGYTRAFEDVLWLVVGLLALSFALAFAMPRQARHSGEP